MEVEAEMDTAWPALSFLSLRTKLWTPSLSFSFRVPSNQQIPPRSRQLRVTDSGEEAETTVTQEGNKSLATALTACGLSHKGEKRSNTTRWSPGSVRASLLLPPTGLNVPGGCSVVYWAVPLGDEIRDGSSLKIH